MPIAGDTATDEAPRDDTAAHRYELRHAGHVAVLTYERHDGTITLVHTEVPSALRGHGVAHELAAFALEAARTAGERVIPKCRFVRAYLRQHPEYAAIVAQET